MADSVKLRKGLQANLPTDKVAGQVLFTTDTGKIFLDVNASTRKELYSNVIAEIRYRDNKLQFFTNSQVGDDGTIANDATPAKTVDIAMEQYIDGTKTKLVSNFAWADATYPGSTNPNLEGKAVLVLAVKGKNVKADGTTEDVTSYSFVSVQDLVDSDKADKITKAADGTTDIAQANADEIVTVKIQGAGTAEDPYVGNIKASGKKVAEEIGVGTSEATATSVSATATHNNIPTQLAVAEGLYEKMDKVEGSHEDELVALDASGNAKTSGVKVAKSVGDKDAAVDTNVPTEKAVRAELDKKADKVTDAGENDIVIFDENGNIADSEVTIVEVVGPKTGGDAATNKHVPTELAVRTELEKRASKLTVTDPDTLAAHEDEIVVYDNAGDIKSSSKKVTTSVRPASLTAEEIAGGKTEANDTAHDDVIPTEKAIRTAINDAVTKGLEWGSF